jgi:hypothetical protein
MEAGWVRVADRLPENREFVIAVLRSSTDKHTLRVVKYSNEWTDHNWECEEGEIANNWDVVYWCPIKPLPPQYVGAIDEEVEG